MDSPMSTVQDRTALVDQIEAITAAEPWRPTTEIVRTARGITYCFDLPGVLQKNLHLACRDGFLLLWGHRNSTAAPQRLEYISNRQTGAFATEVPVPATVEPGRISSEYKDGVLTVCIPTRRASLQRS